jgi:hypothetical protein
MYRPRGTPTTRVGTKMGTVFAIVMATVYGLLTSTCPAMRVDGILLRG